jgi:hypothetical protein
MRKVVSARLRYHTRLTNRSLDDRHDREQDELAENCF